MPYITLPTALVVLTALGLLATLPQEKAQETSARPAPKSPLDFTVKNIDGKETPLSRYRGKVVLIVNTASQCGFTPQYASLETLYQKYRNKGLSILAFPSNDFGGQEPGSEQEIKQFCTGTYKTTFDLFAKVQTRGKGQAPLYAFLTDKETNPRFAGPVEWNFTKFLVGKDGKVIGRFKSNVDPASPEFTAAVETALAVKSQ